MSDPGWITLRQAAALSGLSTKTLRRRIAAGGLPSRMGSHGRRPLLQVWEPALGLDPDNLGHSPDNPVQLPVPIVDIDPLVQALRHLEETHWQERRTVIEMLHEQRQELDALRAELTRAREEKPRPWWKRWRG